MKYAPLGYNRKWSLTRIEVLKKQPLAVLNKRIGFEAKSIYVVIGINLVIGFVLPGIDWHAHLGGLICGAIAALLVLAPTRR